MNYSFTGGLLASIIFLAVVIAIPVKIAASLAGAKRTGIFVCLGAVAVGFFTGGLASVFFGGFIGGPLAGFLGFVLGIRWILGTTYIAAIGLSIVAFFLSAVGFALLVKLGLIVSATSATGIAT